MRGEEHADRGRHGQRPRMRVLDDLVVVRVCP